MKAARVRGKCTVTTRRPMVKPIHIFKDRPQFSFKDYGLRLPVDDLQNVDFDTSSDSESDPSRPLTLPSIDTSTNESESDPSTRPLTLPSTIDTINETDDGTYHNIFSFKPTTNGYSK